MKKIFYHALFLFMAASLSCNNPEPPKQAEEQAPVYQEGEFGYDLQFLQKHDDVVVLKDGDAKVIVSPKYQAKVFTSTADGDKGNSFGWVNYKAFDKVDAHMNGYGGENRIWLGPEGGRFSLFFKPGSKMVFDNWKTPVAVDTESWKVISHDNTAISLHKEMKLLNYANTELNLAVDRSIKILGRMDIIKNIGISIDSSVKAVGYETNNLLINNGKNAWTGEGGMPCIWILDMFKPSPETVIVVPFKKSKDEAFEKIATTNYFGEIPADRLKHNDSLLFFKADGKSRGKLGIRPGNAKHAIGSYDAHNKVLTVLLFDLDGNAKYLNQEWNTTKPSFSGDAVNAYNDGPLADGSQMGPFYEMESVSPAAFLKPGESIAHKHAVFHFSGDEKSLDAIAQKILGVTLENINKAFSNEKTK